VCILYTCGEFFEKLPECNHSASDMTVTPHTLTVLGVHIAHLAYVKAILIACRDQPH